MNELSRRWLIPLLFLLALSGPSARAQEDGNAWAPTPPRLSFIDGEVSYWRPGAEDWARARANLALAEGDALYTGSGANFELQFGSRSFVRADENSELSLLEQDEHRIQFKLTGGRASFDLRRLTVGDAVEVSTPDAVFVIEHPGYYRAEVGSRDTHFITRHGGEATVTTADGRTLGIYPSEDIVVTAGDPVSVATYAAPEPDAWDRWNDARSDRLGESISSRYLPPDVYGAEELDHYGGWRVVPAYGPVWIPYGMGAGWVPYSTGYWVWDPFYGWTWIDDAPWGWAPFHYGRWVTIGGFWAWAPGPAVRRAVYAPALVAFFIRGHDVSARVSIGLPGVWWVALSWGEPVLPWWGAPYRRGHPYWGGWGGPRIVNNVVINQTTVIKTDDIRFRNASLPRAVLSAPADTFGRERVHASVESRFRDTDFAPLRGELPVKPSRASLLGGAPKGVQPPREIVARPVVSMRLPRERERAEPWKDEAPRLRTQAVPESRFVIPPAHRAEEKRELPRPPFGAEAGPERAPPPPPPRYDEMRKSVAPPPPGAARGQSSEVVRERGVERRELQPATRPVPPTRVAPSLGRPSMPGSAEAPSARPESVPPPGTTRSQGAARERGAERRVVRPVPPSDVAPPAAPPAVPGSEAVPGTGAEAAPPRGESRQDRGKSRGRAREEEEQLPGQPANQTFRGREHDNRDAR